ncbi:toll-like receptor 3 [Diabrotica virgifera virgifera]|uniref:Toll-like receptor 3 n=1 Tax=Diabrotica virgifera virgifera TaxID=50390 RepID=A0ABM5IUF2_DIAVI|nr:toll-like receptor 3 [Diabrotica virgifera virgifera]
MLINLVKILLILAIISHKIRHTTQFKCIRHGETLSCKNISVEDIYREYFNEKVKQHQQNLSGIEVSNSNIPSIKSFRRPPQVSNIHDVSIHHSAVKRISNSAFDDFDNLKSLDVSFNFLIDVSFVKSLPKSLTIIKLNNNKISFLDVHFTDFPLISNVDLSFNKIKTLDFGKLITVPDINLSNNRINFILANENNYLPIKLKHLNLSYNNFSHYDEHRLSIAPDVLDLSGNDLKLVDLTYHKQYLSLARSKVETFLTKICANTADLSTFSNISQVKLMVSSNLVLRKNEFRTLSNDTLDLKQFLDYITYYSLDLSDSTIQSIADNYFNAMKFSVLDLSLNYITILKKNTFLYSDIKKLNMSYCVIQVLQSESFSQSTIEELDLSNNRIANLQGVFDDVYIENLDLSFNYIKHLKKDTFARCKDIKTINLSHCLIDTIDPGTFLKLQNLRVQDLSYNKITILDRDMFGLHINDLKLQGNNIHTIKSLAVSNLDHIFVLDLSNITISTIESNAFDNLPRAQELYLTHNNITTVEHTWFAKSTFKRLTKIDLAHNPIKSINKLTNINLNEVVLTINGTLEANSISNVYIKTLTLKDSSIDTLKKNCFRGLFSLTELYLPGSSVGTIETGALNDLFNLEHLDAQNLFKNNKVLHENTFSDFNSMKLLDLSNIGLEELEAFCFKGLKALTYLNLSKNQFSALQNDTYAGLVHLETLDVSLNQLTTIDSNAFRSLGALKELNLKNNRLQNLTVNIFNTLVNLERLNLQKNEISRLERGLFDGLKNLLELNLAETHLTIMDVGVFHQLNNLKVLNLSKNSMGSVKPPRNSFEIGIFSNLANLEILDLSFNLISSLSVKNMFMSLRNLKELLLDHNGLKYVDFGGLLNNCKKLSYIGISFNTWKCEYLADITEKLFNSSISYHPKTPIYSQDNIEGIYCTDVCKFVYCEGSEGSELEIQ